MTLRPFHCGDVTEHAAHEWEHGGRWHCVGTDAAGAAIARRDRYSRFPRWRPPAPIEWGATMCRRRRCVKLAACSIDGEPFCLECADEEIERAAMPIELAAMMPSLDE